MNISEEFEKIPIVLTLKKDTVRSIRLLATYYNDKYLDSFISGEIESIISSLLEVPELEHVFRKY